MSQNPVKIPYTIIIGLLVIGIYNIPDKVKLPVIIMSVVFLTMVVLLYFKAAEHFRKLFIYLTLAYCFLIAFWGFATVMKDYINMRNYSNYQEY